MERADSLEQDYLSFDSNIDEEIDENPPAIFQDDKSERKLTNLSELKADISNPSIKKLLETNQAFKKYPVSMVDSQWRKELPVKRLCEQKIPFLQILKENFGKDLTKITMPVWMNEPLTITQKTIEVLKYWR